MKKVCFLASVVLLAGQIACAETTVTVAEFADSNTAWTVLPAISATDQLNGLVATQIDSKLSHNGTPFTPAKFTDGIANADYPGQYGADYPGVNTPVIQMFWDVRLTGNPVKITEVRCYAANGDRDIRAYPNVDVYVTADVPPTAAGSWTLVAGKAHPFAAPANKDYGTDLAGGADPTPPYLGGVQIKNTAAGAGIAPFAATGLRVDYYAGGFGTNARNPENTDPGNMAVTAPAISEVDAYFASAAAVGEWSVY